VVPWFPRRGWFTRSFTPHWPWGASPFPAAFRSFAAHEVRAETLLHLPKMARHPNNVVQVLDAPGAHVGLQGACAIAEATGAAVTVNIDDITDGRVSGDAATLTEASVRFPMASVGGITNRGVTGPDRERGAAPFRKGEAPRAGKELFRPLR
jgi:hypothetical protein